MKHALYSALTYSKPPPQNSAKTKKLGGEGLHVKAQFVKANNQWG